MTMKPEDIRNMTKDEISNKVSSLKEEVYKLRFEKKTGRIEKPHKMKEAKKDIARCLTILREKEHEKK
jgi:large subunit ribosomal protein L29